MGKFLEALVGLLLLAPLAYVAYLFVSVVFLGESTACPQNLC